MANESDCYVVSPRFSASMLKAPLPLVPQRQPSLGLGGSELLEFEVGDDEVGRLLHRLEDVDEPVSDDVDLRRASRTLPGQLQVGEVPRAVAVVLRLKKNSRLSFET